MNTIPNKSKVSLLQVELHKRIHAKKKHRRGKDANFENPQISLNPHDNLNDKRHMVTTTHNNARGVEGKKKDITKFFNFLNGLSLNGARADEFIHKVLALQVPNHLN